jgi:hypothetical protein
MTRRSHPVPLAWTSFILLCSVVPAVAQQSALDLVPFKATLTGPIPPAVVIPVEPPVGSAHLSTTGQSELLGQVSYLDHHIARIGVDGLPKISEGMAVISAASGDALFILWRGLVRPTATAGVFILDAAFTVTGGRGKLLGATGSGTFTMGIDTVNKKEVAQSFEGMISRPKP